MEQKQDVLHGDHFQNNIGVIAMHRDSKDRHRQKIRENDHYNDLEERKVSDKARERFERKPYQITDVAGYMAKKYDIKREMEP